MRPNTPDDVWRFVDRRGADECWPWTGLLYRNGYGRFNLNRTSYGAHRIVCELANGSPRPGELAMHKCNNKACCNPDHLIWGSGSENQRHASSSGCFATGATGLLGISIDKVRNYWTAQGYINGKRYNLYTGPYLEKAISARANWEKQHEVSFS
jgi:hypothetical protein